MTAQMCICCDNLAGQHAVPMLSSDGLNKLCRGCARPSHRNAPQEKRDADHLEPDWIATRLDA
jgi:hypothetical protein